MCRLTLAAFVLAVFSSSTARLVAALTRSAVDTAAASAVAAATEMLTRTDAEAEYSVAGYAMLDLESVIPSTLWSGQDSELRVTDSEAPALLEKNEIRRHQREVRDLRRKRRSHQNEALALHEKNASRGNEAVALHEKKEARGTEAPGSDGKNESTRSQAVALHEKKESRGTEAPALHEKNESRGNEAPALPGKNDSRRTEALAFHEKNESQRSEALALHEKNESRGSEATALPGKNDTRRTEAGSAVKKFLASGPSAASGATAANSRAAAASQSAGAVGNASLTLGSASAPVSASASAPSSARASDSSSSSSGSAAPAASTAISTLAPSTPESQLRATSPADEAAFEAASRSETTYAQLRDRVHVQILGQYDTGTNLLKALLEANFPDQLEIYEYYAPSAQFWKRSQDPLCFARIGDQPLEGAPQYRLCGFWKHANLDIMAQRAPSRLAQYRNRSVIGLAMIRDPLSWLQSVRMAPYDLGTQLQNDDWLLKKLSYPEVLYGGLPCAEFRNLGEIWTNWTKSYERMSSYGFRQSLLLRYEDLVQDTEAILRQIAETANLPVPTKVKQVENTAKMQPKSYHASSGREAAINKIKARSYLQEYSAEETRVACMTLDQATMARHNYTVCDDLFSHPATEMGNRAERRAKRGVKNTSVSDAPRRLIKTKQ